MVVGWGEELHVAHRFIELSKNLDLLENLLKRHIHVCLSTYQFFLSVILVHFPVFDALHRVWQTLILAFYF